MKCSFTSQANNLARAAKPVLLIVMLMVKASEEYGLDFQNTSPEDKEKVLQYREIFHHLRWFIVLLKQSLNHFKSAVDEVSAMSEASI